LVRMKLLAYLNERVGEQMEAVITGVEQFGIFVQGLELPAEGLIHIQSLADDYYDFDRTTHSLTGRRSGNTFRMGDVVQAEIFRVDLDRRELDFRLAGEPDAVAKPSPRRPAPKRKSSGKSTKKKTKGKSSRRGRR